MPSSQMHKLSWKSFI